MGETVSDAVAAHERMPRPRARVAVLASGGGSNLQAVLDYLESLGDRRAADVALVVSNRRDAGALDRAARSAVPGAVADDPRDASWFFDRFAAHGVDLVVLAGYLKLVPADVVRRFRGRMLNVHPALLPSFGGTGLYGHRVHDAVLASGAKVTGATVHFVDEQYDRGPIIAQWPTPVFATDFAETLAARVLRAEHLLLPRVVDAVAAGRVRLAPDGSVVGAFADGPADAVFTFGTGGAAARDLDRVVG